MADLEIKNLHVSAGDKQILKGVDLHVRSGEFHALMGPNGSGKSTLANALMGHPNLEVTEGQILLDGEDITEADPDERARAGLFMAFQYPVAIPGVTVTKYLRMVMNAHREARGEEPISLKDFRKTVEAAMALTKVPKEFSTRYLNEGFSGGEKKRMEILQLALLLPKLAVLDETDSGLDIDALNTVAAGRQRRRRGDRHGHAGHHPLPADPPHREAAVRPHHVRGADRQGGRAGARRAARGARLRLDPRGGRRGRMSLLAPAAADFPTLPHTGVAYLDSGATSQTPMPVIEAMDAYYREYRASVHRGVYPIAALATEAYEGARDKVAAFAGSTPGETVFTRNATEAINLVAYSWGSRQRRAPATSIVITEMEHHSNLVPVAACSASAPAPSWRTCRSTTRACWSRRSSTRCSPAGRSSSRVAHVSNVLGTVNPIADDRRPRPRRRRGRAGRRRAGRAAPAARRARARRRLLRLDRPQGLRADGHRRAARPPRAAGGDAAVPRRRAHDRQGREGAQPLRRAADEVRGRHVADRRGRRRSAPPSTTSAASAWTSVWEHSRDVVGYAVERLRERRRAGDPRPVRPRAAAAA